MAHRYSKYLPGLTLLFDLLILNLSLFGSLFLLLNFGNGIKLIIAANLVWLILSMLLNVYKISRPLALNDFIAKFFKAALYHLLITIVGLYALRRNTVSLQSLILSYLVFTCLVAVQRYCLSNFLDYIRKLGFNRRKILILGDKAIADKLAEHFLVHPEYGYCLVHNNFGKNIDELSEEEIHEKLRANGPDEIFLCYKEINAGHLSYFTNFGLEYAIKIKLVSDLILTDSYARIVNYKNLPILQLESDTNLINRVNVAKRGFDILFSATAILAGSPILIMLYLITKMTSRGPAYYSQERVGLNGKPFQIIKFRSMYTDAEKFGPALASQNDPRVTRWGRLIRKTRLDELPQFWNVLKGDMSIVGYRPERQHFIDKITQKSPQYKQLLSIKPGITSIGQVHYGYAENVDQMCERMQYDLLYLQNMSLNSDLKLILRTVQVMVQGKGK